MILQIGGKKMIIFFIHFIIMNVIKYMNEMNVIKHQLLDIYNARAVDELNKIHYVNFPEDKDNTYFGYGYDENLVITDDLTDEDIMKMKNDNYDNSLTTVHRCNNSHRGNYRDTHKIAYYEIDVYKYDNPSHISHKEYCDKLASFGGFLRLGFFIDAVNESRDYYEFPLNDDVEYKRLERFRVPQCAKMNRFSDEHITVDENLGNLDKEHDGCYFEGDFSKIENLPKLYDFDQYKRDFRKLKIDLDCMFNKTKNANS